jgi:hypothetical protein
MGRKKYHAAAATPSTIRSANNSGFLGLALRSSAGGPSLRGDSPACGPVHRGGGRLVFCRGEY